MAFSRAWLNFKRMEDITVVAAGLIYTAAALRAFQLLPGSAAEVARWTLGWPSLYLLASAVAPLLIAPVRRGLARYVWMSFRAGFGQSPGSVLAGLALLLGAALLIYREMGTVARTGRYPANIFSAYAAGIGILIAQAVLVRALERRPEVRAEIEER
ncbi:hypothetical protein [Phenylobacterium sp.]|jgi:hypothetical protein|uniref:hypothetical protein n=1 Tax=Phenylobacterium sp. TaxID=1871053 RepID=UPI002F4077C4